VSDARRIVGDVSDPQPDDARRSLGRWAVRFRGTLTAETAAELEAQDIKKRSLDHLFEPRLPDPSATVQVRTAGEGAAIRRVQKALEGRGDFSGFEAELLP
jgi:hypothetical protein